MKYLEVLNNKKFSYFISGFVIILSFILQYIMYYIGPDSGFTLSTAQKIIEGKRYYYDFFETNFPSTFYISTIPVFFSKITGINPIISFVIFYNLLGIVLLFISVKVLNQTDIFGKDRKDFKLFNIFIFSISIIYFLRPYSILLNEFCTKTSLYIFCAIPYVVSFFKEERNKYSIGYKILFGILLAILVSLKPHYAVVPLALEIYLILKTKNFFTFLRLEIYVSLVLYLIYVLFLIFIIPEFLFKNLPIALYSYPNGVNFVGFFLRYFISISFIIIAYNNYKKDSIDDVLFFSYIASIILIISERIISRDQSSCYFAFEFLAFVKLFYNFILIEKGKLSFIPFFGILIIEIIFIPYSGIIYPINFLFMNIPFIIVLLLVAFEMYKKKNKFIYNYLFIASSIYFAGLISSIVFINNYLHKPTEITLEYLKKYSEGEDVLFISSLTIGPYPAINYANINYSYKVPCTVFMDNAKKKAKNSEKNMETYNYLKNALEDELKKEPRLIFVDKFKRNSSKENDLFKWNSFIDLNKYYKIGNIDVIYDKDLPFRINLLSGSTALNYEIEVFIHK